MEHFMEKETFTTFDIIKALGIPRERLQDWMNRGFVKPSIPATGKGTKAFFTLLDVYALALFQHLVEERHFSREDAAKYSIGWLLEVNALFKRGGSDKAKANFSSNELICVFATENKEKKLLFRPFSFHGKKDKYVETILKQLKLAVEGEIWDDIFVVNFKKIRDGVDAALEEKK
jgi:hypothetical protein